MRQLRFVTRSEDGSHLLVETADSGEQFTLPVDAALREASGSDLPRLPRPAAAGPTHQEPTHQERAHQESAPSPAPTPESIIGPREIQVRVRAGESPQDLADAHGMTLERVLRFAGAVIEERHRIAGEARRARARRSNSDGTENKVVMFGEAVDDRFIAHGIDAASVTWDAWRREDGEWVIAATWLGGDGTHSAQWLFHRGSRSVTPIDDTAADLLSDRPIRPIARPEPVRPSLVSAPPLAPGIVAFPPMPDAHTAPVPVLEEVYDQDAAPDGPRNVPPFVTPAAAAYEAAFDFDAPPLPLGITDPDSRPAAAQNLGTPRKLGATRRDESEEERTARARVPSWDDILLGVRRKTD
ncbi:MAG: hypothetical protein QOG01_869 [Pseudonocardiales bacterium]|jgi:hypothetical protein|nr:hypothetical protein [Pseudonocardiales bacterium]